MRPKVTVFEKQFVKEEVENTNLSLQKLRCFVFSVKNKL